MKLTEKKLIEKKGLYESQARARKPLLDGQHKSTTKYSNKKNKYSTGYQEQGKRIKKAIKPDNMNMKVLRSKGTKGKSLIYKIKNQQGKRPHPLSSILTRNSTVQGNPGD